VCETLVYDIIPYPYKKKCCGVNVYTRDKDYDTTNSNKAKEWYDALIQNGNDALRHEWE
jgi:hypothetical protein